MKKILSIVLIGLSTCEKPREYWSIPENEKEIIKSNIEESDLISVVARENREGSHLIRMMTSTAKVDERIMQINKKYSLARYHSSMGTANNLATSNTKGAMHTDEDWVPKGFNLVDAYTGDGVSLARYDFKEKDETIIIIYIRSQKLQEIYKNDTAAQKQQLEKPAMNE